MTNLPFKHLKEVANDYDLFLFDMWGVLIEADETYIGVIDEINKLSKDKKVLFVTNAPRPNYVIANNLIKWGAEGITLDRVFTSGDVARNLIRTELLDKNIVPKILHLGEDRNKEILQDIDCEKISDVDEADILLLTLQRDEHDDIHEFDKLFENAAKKKDLMIICANPDTIVPNRGMLRYCPGYFANLIEKAGGTVIYSGKPKREIYDHILALYPDIKKERILMIGDTFDTDILGAKTVGIKSALVLTGNSQLIHGIHPTPELKIKALEEYSEKAHAAPDFILSIL